MHILLATDFSTRSDRALRRAVLLARDWKADLTIVHVVDDDQPAYLVDHQSDAATELLAQATRTIVNVDGVAADFLVIKGDAFAGIIAAADQLDPDLIVVGPHRRQFLDTFVGTTAERTIRRSQRPVLMANAVPAGPYLQALVAVDLDEASRAMLESCARLELTRRVDTAALHLFDVPGLGMMKRTHQAPEATEDYLRGEESRAAAELDRQFTESGFRPARRILKPYQGSASGGILSTAKEQDADLIVLGTNQRSGLTRLIMGSVAVEVLLEADRDVLVVPAARRL